MGDMVLDIAFLGLALLTLVLLAYEAWRQR
jgi:hypothetical protein